MTHLWLPLAVAALDWLAVFRRWRSLGYLTKPGAMIAILLWLFWGWPAGVAVGAMGWFAAGIFLSLLGDVFLMLPREQFIAGLVAFLLGHIAYIIGLNLTAPPFSLVTLGLLLAVGGIFFLLYRLLATALRDKGRQRLLKPVQLYSVVISVMLLSAWLTLLKAEWRMAPALLVSGGATLFFISDALLAWNRFVRPIPHGQLWVRITYHLGQMGLVAGAGLHFW